MNVRRRIRGAVPLPSVVELSLRYCAVLSLLSFDPFLSSLESDVRLSLLSAELGDESHLD